MSYSDVGEILKLVKENQISWEEGYKRIQAKKQSDKTYRTDVSREKEEENQTKFYLKNSWEEDSITVSEASNQQVGNILIFDTGEELWKKASKKLTQKQENNQVILIKPGTNYQQLEKKKYIINPDCQEDYKRLLKEFKERDVQFKKVIHAWSREDYNLDLLEDQMKKGIYSFFYLSKMIMEYKPEDRVDLLYMYPSCKGKLQPHYAAVSGLAKTIARENKKIMIKILKVQVSKESEFKSFLTSDKFLQKELNTFDVSEVCYRNGQRFVKTLKEIDMETNCKEPTPLNKEGTYLITGGTGSLGFIFAEYLAKKYGANLILTGRSNLNEQKKDKIRKIQSLGSDVIYLTGNVANKEDVEFWVQEAKAKYKQIDGVIHCAGINRDSLIINKTKEEFKSILAAKVYGTIFLDLVTQNEELDCFITFSSTSAIFGNRGQAAYAYANSFMDHFVKLREEWRQAEKRSGRSLTINWPLWKEGGMSIDEHTLQLVSENTGLSLITEADGIKVFKKGLSLQPYQLIFLKGNKDKLQNYLVHDAPQPLSLKSNQKEEVESKEDILVKLQEKLISYVAKILKIAPEEVYLDLDMQEYGFDSITQTKFVNKINETYDLKITPAIFYELPEPTLRSLSNYLFANNKENIKDYYDQTAEELSFADSGKKEESIENENQGGVTNQAEKGNQEIISKVQTGLIDNLRRILKINPERIYLDTDMQEYGFDSITQTKFVNKINETYDLEITPAIFYELPEPTLRSLSNYLFENNKEKIKKYYNQLASEEISSDKEEANEQKEEPIKSDEQEDEFSKDEGQVKVKNLESKEGSSPEETEREPIAIVGMSCKLPQSETPEAFWENLVQEKDLVSEYPSDRYGKEELARRGIKRGGFIEDVDKFDPEFFGISPREAKLMDPQQRIFLQLVWKAIEDAGHKMSNLSGTKTGVFVGSSASDYFELWSPKLDEVEGHVSTGNAHSILANRISYLFNLRGPSESIDTACSSSLTAVHRSIQAMRFGTCNRAIVGGVTLVLSPTWFQAYNKAGMLSKDGRCKTFDEKADGYVRGEGAGVVFLKPLSKAVEDGDHVYAVIKGSSENHGGHAQSLTAPNANAQAELIVDAYERANISPETVSYIETHGTGTKLGDPTEVNGLKKAFNELYEKEDKSLPEDSYCGLGSVKSNIGHLEAAAGISALTKVLLALRHETIPATINFEQLNPYIDLTDSPFYIADTTQRWNHLDNNNNSPVPRRAGISSFGYGGANVHIVLEEYQEKKIKNSYPQQKHIFVLSAQSRERLIAYAQKMIKFLEKSFPSKLNQSIEATDNDSSISLPEIIYTMQVGREEMRSRLAIVVASIEELGKKLIRFVNGEEEIKALYQDSIANSDEATIDISQEKVSELIKDGKLNRIADFYVSGAEIDWQLFYSTKDLNRVSLPTYPFKKESFWFESSSKCLEAEEQEEEDLKMQTEKQKRGALEMNGVDFSSGKQDSEEEKISLKESSNKSSDVDLALVKYLKQILAEVIHTDFSEIEEDKPFIDLGLDSILGLEFIKTINEEFELEIKVTKLYDYSTVNELAQYLESLNVTYEPEEPNFAGDQNQAEHASRGAEEEKEKISLATPNIQEKSTDDQNKDIAIVGISAQFPNSENTSVFWDNLRNGEDLITEVPPERWDVDEFYVPDSYTSNKSYSKWGGFLEDVDKFDPLFFNISPAEAEELDPQQRLFLQEAWRALEDAGYSAEKIDDTSCGVYTGVMTGDSYSANLFNSHSILAARIAYFLNLKGPAISIDTACSSSLVAVHLACQSLINGETEMMLAGGVNLYLDEKPYLKMSKAGMLSPEGKCKTFDNDADGFVPGEGVGVIALKPLDKAVKDKDHIYGVIKSSAINQDGRTNGITAPSVQSQIELERTVYEKANISPETISYVECHGTGTRLGDPIEIEALTEVFREYTDKEQYCPVGSVKTNIGHASAASGIAGIIKVLLGLKHNQIPPSINFEEENEHIDFSSSPFYVNTKLKDWDKPKNHPRRAAVSSFGYSGTNGHLIIEEGPSLERENDFKQSCPPFYLIPFAAKKEAVLEQELTDMINYLENEKTNAWIGDIAYTLSLGRSHFAYRSALIVKDTADLRDKLKSISTANEDSVENYFTGEAEADVSYSEASFKELKKSLVNKLKKPNNFSSSEYQDKLRALADLYVKGFDPNWTKLFQNGSYRRIPLPTYPFAQESYWMSETVEGKED